MKMSVKIFLVVGFLMVNLVSVGGIGVYNLFKVDTAIQDNLNMQERLQVLYEIVNLAFDRTVAEKNIILTKDENQIANIIKNNFLPSEEKMNVLLTRYKELLSGDVPDDVKKRPENLRLLWNNFVNATNEASQLSLENTNNKAIRLFAADWPGWKKVYDGFSELIELYMERVSNTEDGKLLKNDIFKQKAIEDVRLGIINLQVEVGRLIDASDSDFNGINTQVEQLMKSLRQNFTNLISLYTGTKYEEQFKGYSKQAELLLANIPTISKLAKDNTNIKAEEKSRLVVVPARQKLDSEAVSYLESNKQQTKEINAAVMAAAKTAEWFMILASVIGILISAVIAYVVIRGIVAKLNIIIDNLDSGANQVSDAAGQISGSSQNLAEGATEQAASLEETSAALEQMASMTRQNADNSQKTSVTTTQTVTLVSQGAVAVRNMSSAMAEINDSAEKIGRIIKTIEEIAFQTNLLALNAAVEAARAGEAGKGFAVVADEVRNLAQRSAQAARDTAELIGGTVTRVHNGAEIAQHLDSSFKEIEEGTQEVGRLISEITSATNEQAQGVDQINSAIAQMDKVTQKNAANAEETASASEELSAQSVSLKEAVSILVALVHGEKGQHAASSRRGGGASYGQQRNQAPKANAAAVRAPNRKKLPAPQPDAKVMRPNDIIPLDNNDDFSGF